MRVCTIKSGAKGENLNGFPRAFGNHKEALWCVRMGTGPSKYLQSSEVVKKPQAQSDSLEKVFKENLRVSRYKIAS